MPKHKSSKTMYPPPAPIVLPTLEEIVAKQVYTIIEEGRKATQNYSDAYFRLSIAGEKLRIQKDAFKVNLLKPRNHHGCPKKGGKVLSEERQHRVMQLLRGMVDQSASIASEEVDLNQPFKTIEMVIWFVHMDWHKEKRITEHLRITSKPKHLISYVKSFKVVRKGRDKIRELSKHSVTAKEFDKAVPAIIGCKKELLKEFSLLKSTEDRAEVLSALFQNLKMIDHQVEGNSVLDLAQYRTWGVEKQFNEILVCGISKLSKNAKAWVDYIKGDYSIRTIRLPVASEESFIAPKPTKQ